MCFIALICNPEFIFASTNLIEEALSLESKNPEAAENLFLKIERTDPQFKIVVEELQKIFYREGNWPRFFGYAQYYRKRWPIAERNQTQFLEVIALLRHCQNELVSRFVDAYKKELPRYADKLNQIKSLSNTRFKGKGASEKSVKSIQNHFEGQSLWPLPSDKIAEVNPKNLRIAVENQCSF
ncbi:MAG: hypothetical protein JWQ35_2580 [Bacteriovoracaceae bacterium]|nr:hypothetical protein [Bacteriovoracaceae bacterium]